KHPVSHLHAVRIAELGRWKRLAVFDLDDREVSFLVGADHLRVVLHTRRIVLQSHADAICLIHYVAVRDDVSLRVHQHSGTERAFPHRARISALPAKEAIEEILEWRVVALPTLIALISRDLRAR